MVTQRSKIFAFLVFTLAVSAMVAVGIFFFSIPRFGTLRHTNNVIQAAGEIQVAAENAIRSIDNPSTAPAELKVIWSRVPPAVDALTHLKPESDDEKKLASLPPKIIAAGESVSAAIRKLDGNADPAGVSASKADARRPLTELKGHVIEIVSEESFLMGVQTSAVALWTSVTMAMLCVTGFLGAVVAFMAVRTQQTAADNAPVTVPARAAAPAAPSGHTSAVDDARQREIELADRLCAVSPVGMMVYGLDGRVRYGNASALRILGMRHDDIVSGRADTNRITLENADGTPIAPQDRPSVRALRRAETVSEHAIRATAPWLSAPIYISISALPLRDRGGSIDGALVQIRSIPAPAPKPEPVAITPPPAPIAAPKPTPVQEVPHPVAPAVKQENTAAPRAVMVIQSDDRIRPLVVQTLRNSGYYVEAFTDAESAYEVFRSQPARWNVLVIDLNLVGLDGTSALRRMRRLRPDQPALILVDDEADATPDTADQATRLLLKPFTMNAMRTTLADLVPVAV